jgi:hypothetical protein
VTGASSGIGEQYARQLSERGYRVAIVARREDRLVRLAEELGGPERAVAIAADLTVPADRDRLAARIDELGARVDVLVNNAGHGIYAPFVESGRDRELEQVYLLVEAPVDRMARYLPGMVDRGHRQGTDIGDPRRPQVKATLAPNRKLPRWLVLPISKRMMARR